MNKVIWWKVYLNGELVDEIHYADHCDKDYVYESLVNHDGYDPAIIVSQDIN